MDTKEFNGMESLTANWKFYSMAFPVYGMLKIMLFKFIHVLFNRKQLAIYYSIF